MNQKWEKEYPSGRIYRDISSKEYKVDESHIVLLILHDNCIDSYVMEKKPDEPLGTPFMYMFGTPLGQMPYSKIVEMTIRNAPDYYHLCEVGY